MAEIDGPEPIRDNGGDSDGLGAKEAPDTQISPIEIFLSGHEEETLRREVVSDQVALLASRVNKDTERVKEFEDRIRGKREREFGERYAKVSMDFYREVVPAYLKQMNATLEELGRSPVSVPSALPGITMMMVEDWQAIRDGV